jgi:hypothetical protein
MGGSLFYGIQPGAGETRLAISWLKVPVVITALGFFYNFIKCGLKSYGLLLAN